MKARVLFVCTYHGARSRIAEQYARRLASEAVEVYSASFEPGTIGSLPVSVMKEAGFDLPREAAKSVYDRFRDKEDFDYVVTMCYEAAREQCAIFRSNIDVMYAKKSQIVSWSVPDFKTVTGSDEQRISEAREIRDLIMSQVVQFLSSIGAIDKLTASVDDAEYRTHHDS